MPLSFKVGVAYGGGTQRQCHFTVCSLWIESLLSVFKTMTTSSLACKAQVPGGVCEEYGHVSCFHRFLAKRRGWVMAGGGETEQRIPKDACIMSNIVNIL